MNRDRQMEMVRRCKASELCENENGNGALDLLGQERLMLKGGATGFRECFFFLYPRPTNWVEKIENYSESRAEVGLFDSFFSAFYLFVCSAELQ